MTGSKPHVVVLDYGSGNLPSADKALRKAAARLQAPMMVVTTDDPGVIARADRVVLPGVGAFASGVHMYFTHSYALHAEHETDVAAWTEHGAPFAAAVVRGNISGVQFHPEKSQGAGARLLENFLKWRP